MPMAVTKLTVRLFQSSPSPKTGRYLYPFMFYAPLLFQSSPSPKTGRYARRPQSPVLRAKYVPILTQSENWALLGNAKPLPNEQNLFQSSPSPKTGRYRKVWVTSKISSVPILTQSENWALLYLMPMDYRQVNVPILTQSENWALY